MYGFKHAVEEGAVSGAVFGAFSGANVVSGKLLDKLIPWSWVRIPLKVVANSIAGAAVASLHRPSWMQSRIRTRHQNLWLATGVGAIEGIPFGLGDIGAAPAARRSGRVPERSQAPAAVPLTAQESAGLIRR